MTEETVEKVKVNERYPIDTISLCLILAGFQSSVAFQFYSSVRTHYTHTHTVAILLYGIMAEPGNPAGHSFFDEVSDLVVV